MMYILQMVQRVYVFPSQYISALGVLMSMFPPFSMFGRSYWSLHLVVFVTLTPRGTFLRLFAMLVIMFSTFTVQACVKFPSPIGIASRVYSSISNHPFMTSLMTQSSRSMHWVVVVLDFWLIRIHLNNDWLKVIVSSVVLSPGFYRVECINIPVLVVKCCYQRKCTSVMVMLVQVVCMIYFAVSIGGPILDRIVPTLYRIVCHASCRKQYFIAKYRLSIFPYLMVHVLSGTLIQLLTFLFPLVSCNSQYARINLLSILCLALCPAVPLIPLLNGLVNMSFLYLAAPKLSALIKGANSRVLFISFSKTWASNISPFPLKAHGLMESLSGQFAQLRTSLSVLPSLRGKPPGHPSFPASNLGTMLLPMPLPTSAHLNLCLGDALGSSLRSIPFHLCPSNHLHLITCASPRSSQLSCVHKPPRTGLQPNRRPLTPMGLHLPLMAV